MEQKKVIISGTGGWLGKNTITSLKGKFDLVCLSRNKQFVKQNEKYSFFWDASKNLDEIIHDKEHYVLLHTAAYPYRLFKTKSKTTTYAEQINREVKLLKSLISGAPPKKIIYISSSSVNSLGDHFIAQDYQNVSKYGLAKFVIEQELVEYATINQIPYSILRPHSIFCYEECPSDNLGHLYSDLIYKILILKTPLISVNLPKNYMMTFTPEEFYIKSIENEILSDKPSNIINIINIWKKSLYDFVNEVTDFGLKEKILKVPPKILYKQDFNDRQSLALKKVDSCNVNPTELISKYLSFYFTNSSPVSN